MLTLGIDIGSTTSKCAVLRDGAELLATSLVVAGIGTMGAEERCWNIIGLEGAYAEGYVSVLDTLREQDPARYSALWEMLTEQERRESVAPSMLEGNTVGDAALPRLQPPS